MMAYIVAPMDIDTLRSRLQVGVNLSQLARRAGVGLRTVRRLKNGDRSADARTVEKLAKALRRVKSSPPQA